MGGEGEDQGSASFFEKKEAKKLLSMLAVGAMAFG
jgi:hypothetical protein